MNPYIGHESQLYGIEEHRLVGGKGDGMRLLQVRNGKGLELTVSLDRCADISRFSLNGVNVGFFSPCGYVAPSYFHSKGTDWLKSFTAGFMTTCGLENAGPACEDEGETLSLHGSVANIPAEHVCWYEETDELVIRAQIRDEVMFGRKYILRRQIRVSLEENAFRIVDTVENTGDTVQPLAVLYHINFGYPILDVDTVVTIPTPFVTARTANAIAGIDDRLTMEKPQPGYQEQCFFYTWSEDKGGASVFQPKLNLGVSVSFDTEQLDCLTEWKMMGFRDYALGIEPGNCHPGKRSDMRSNGKLKFLEPGQKKEFSLTFRQLR